MASLPETRSPVPPPALPGPDGLHCTLEASGAPADFLDDEAGVAAAIRSAVAAGGATLLDLAVRRFEPQGVTAVALLAESHLSVHTWPEHGYAAIDAYTCGTRDPEAMARAVAASLRAASVSVQVHRRGPGA